MKYAPNHQPDCVFWVEYYGKLPYSEEYYDNYGKLTIKLFLYNGDILG